MPWSNPLLAWCRSRRNRRPVATIRRASSLGVEPLEVRCVPATFIVANQNDGGAGSGSLRSAIISANTSFQNQTNTINLDGGTYTLSLAGQFEDKAATGDLDITGTQTMIIQGAGAGQTFIDAKQIDRVFDVIGSGVTVTFKNLTITGGYIESTPGHLTLHGGGILNEGGNVTLSGVTVTGNELTGYTDTAGGGVYSDGGRLTVTGSTISSNKLGYIEEFAGNLYGTDGARGDSGHPTGYNGTAGQNAPAGGAVSGGGVFVRNATTAISSSTIGSNTIRAGDGVTGGGGGAGGAGNKTPVSLFGGDVLSGDQGGNGGTGGAGGRGGDASGAAVATSGGTLTLTDVQISGNSATAGNGGSGGLGGTAGGYVSSAGNGGAAGNGGEARGAVFATGQSTLSITGVTVIQNNAAAGGVGGVGGRGGVPCLGGLAGGFNRVAFAGPSGTGGFVSGAAVTIDDGTATLAGVRIQSNTALAGAGGDGPPGAPGHDELDANDTDQSFPGGDGGAGGTGGSVHGGAVYVGSVALSMADTTVAQNTATAGAGGKGGSGGTGGSGGVRGLGFATGGPGSAGGTGGSGGAGGTAEGGGVYASGNAAASVRSTTVSNNTVTAGTGGTGGSGGGGGAGGYGIFDDGGDARGGNGGSGGSGGSASSGGLYARARDSANRMTVASSTVAFNTMAGGAGGAKGTGGLGGDGGSGGNGTSGNAGGATTSMNGGGVVASGYVTLANVTVAYNTTGIYAVPAGSPSSVQVRNTISAQNTALDLAGPITTGGYNLIGAYDTAAASGLGTTDVRGSVASPRNPQLSTVLQNKGGSTAVLYPNAGSPAIDAGGTPLAGLATDQRGLPRTIGSALDIGAVEVATNFFSATYNFPTSVAAGTDVTVPVTVFMGDSAGTLDSAASVRYLKANQDGLVTLTASGLPAGWTVTPSFAGYILHAPSLAVGRYTFTLTMHVDSSVTYGTQIQPWIVDGISSGYSTLASPTVVVRYPVPTITSINPTFVNEGSSPTLTVIGTGFGFGSVVKWNGTALTTTYVNRTTLTATLPASLAESGTANVTIFSPTPGGGTSAAKSFAVTNVNPTGVIPDRYLLYPGSGTVNVTGGFISAFDPSVGDTVAGLHYSFATSAAGLMATYAAAGTTKTYTVAVSGVGQTTYYARVFDKDGGYTDYTANVFAVASNTAPTLSGANNLPTIDEDNVTNAGATVASLIAGKFADADAVSGMGIAVTGLTGTHGKWQFSTDGGTAWTDFGSVSDATATLLGASLTDRVRYLPDAQDGTTATITFRAWDQTDGRTTGATGVNVSASGGSTAYGATPATATQVVTEVNDRPVFTTLDYSMGRDGVLRIPVADVLAATPPGPPPESGQTLTLLNLRVDAFGQVTGSAAVSGSNIVFRPTIGQSGYALVYYTVQDNGTTSGVLDTKQNEGLIRVYVDPTPAPGAADDTLPAITQGAPAFVIPDTTLVANDQPTVPRNSGGSVTLVSVADAVGGTVELIDAPAHGDQVQFTPDPTFTGVASFTYTITDDQSHTQSEATVRFVVQPSTPVINLSPPVGWTTATWADVNGDGHLDAVVGWTVYLSDGTGNFTSRFDTIGLPQLNSIQFGDFNRDGYLDVLGTTTLGEAEIYEFDAATGMFTQASFSYAAYGFTSVEYAYWADLNNDGALDIILSGHEANNNVGISATGYMMSDGAGNFLPYGGPSLLITSASFADANGDGYLDMLANTSSGPRYFQNSGGFLGNPANPTHNSDGTISAWGDYDGDGFPDFVASGVNPQVGPEFGLYHNNGNGTFTGVGAVESSQQNEANMQWADVDSDGDPDLIFTRNGFPFIDVNDGGLLRRATVTDVPVRSQIGNSAIAWGDFNGNGTLDVLQPASSSIFPTVVENYGATPTSRPGAPTNLTATFGTGSKVHLSWDPGSDDNTPQPALTYTIRIGTTPGGNDVMSAPSLADGTRLVAAAGAFSHAFADVSLVGGRTYYWEVQSVDATFSGSVFSSGSFLFNHPPTSNGGFAFTNEDTTLLLKPSNFNTSDEDHDTIRAIRIDSLPTNGTLLYQGEAVAAGQVIPAAGPDYNASDWLVYVPPENASDGTAPLDSLTFAASDGAAFGNTSTFQIAVSPVADTPYLTVSDFTTGVGAPAAFPIDAGTPDADGSETISIQINFQSTVDITLSAGTFSNGSWILTPDDLVGLQITVGQPASPFDVNILVSSRERFGPGSSAVFKTITVTPVAPTIDPFTVPSTGVEGTPVSLSASASDTSGTGLTYTWTVYSPNGEFELDGANASFTPPDDGPYAVVLSVTNGLGSVTRADPQLIRVANADPVITLVSNDGPVGEGSPVTITVDATDVAGDYDPLDYAFDYDDNGTYESTSPTHVFLTKGTYPVNVRVGDGDNGFAYDRTTVTVTHANPTTPTDGNTATGNAVVEGAANGTPVGITASSTQALGLPITYSLLNGASSPFSINPTTGVVVVRDATLLDFETATSHAITVQADDGQGGLSTADFTIAVTNANPSAPVDTDPVTNTVVEGAASGTVVGIDVDASDVNGPAVTFSLMNSAGGRFAIDSTTGVVTVANATLLDFETNTSHTITVQASDGKGGVSTADFTIAVINANPSTPTDSDAATNAVVEGAVNGTPVGITAAATDPNGPAVTYTLLDSAGGRFAINPTTGVVTVANAALLDFETATSHTITVQASDGGGTSTANFTIGVTNANPSTPTDTDAAANTVIEGAANGTPVGLTAAATDVNGPVVTYTLTDNAGGRFAINAATGVVTVANAALLNFETATSHNITVQASDGTGSSTQTFNIAITNASPSTPTDSDNATNTVVEGAANGTSVGITAVASDVNGPAVTYSLTNSAGGRFAINPATGVVTVASAALLDFESATSHTITVQASDGKGGVSTADFTIAVTNASPSTPTDNDSAANTVVEGAANGTLVGVTASATDPNGPAATFTLTNSAGGRFAINPTTGVVTVANSTLLDFETATSHTITVQASDGTGTSSQTFTIGVTNANPSAPTDADAAANAVVEGAANGALVGLTAAAADVNGPVVIYTLTDNAGGRFAINAATGVVTVANAALLDFETATSHNITVKASDGHGGTSTQTFTVTVTNANPGTPVDADVAANATADGLPNGSPVGITASATDPNGPSVTYTLLDNAGGRFAISPTTGVVTVADSSLIAGPATYTITVQASDGVGGTSAQTFAIAAARAKANFDFQLSATSPLQPGSLAVLPGTAYTPTQGYGWLATPKGYDNGTLAVLMGNPWAAELQDGMSSTGKGLANAATFRFDLGSILPVQLTAFLGDGKKGYDGLEVAYSTDGVNFTAFTPAGGVSVAVGAFTTITSPGVVPGTVGGLHPLWVRFQDASGSLSGWAAAGLSVRPVAQVGILTVVAAGGPLTADASTVDTFRVSGATPGALLTISASLGTVVTDARGEVVGNQVIAGTDGTATFQVRRPFRDGSSTISVVEFSGSAAGSTTQDYVLPNLRKFDMTSSSASVPDASWLSVRGNALYTAATGYGWTTAATTEGDSATNFPAGSGATDQNLYRDYHLGGGVATFQVYVGIGKSASVKVYSYPQSVYSLGMAVTAENGTTATVGSTVPYVTVTGKAGADGILTVTVRGGIFGMWLVNAMEVTVQ